MALSPATHYGRSLPGLGHSLEDVCRCPKQLCGLIAGADVVHGCQAHEMWLRGALPLQSHRASRCPARPRVRRRVWVPDGKRVAR